MNRITLASAEAKRLAVGTLAAMPADATTPIIYGAHVSLQEDGTVVAVATDRYRVHRIFTQSYGDTHVAHEIVIPKDAVKWLAANAVKLGFFSKVTIESEPRDGVYAGLVRIRVAAGMPDGADADESLGLYAYSCQPTAGNFPPVARLYESSEPAVDIADTEVAVNPDFLVSLAALKRGKYNIRAKIRHTKRSLPGKPGPLMFEFTNSDAPDVVYADALVQPIITY